MNKDELRAKLYNKATELRGWFAYVLEELEKRTPSEIEEISRSVLNNAYRDGFTDDELFLLWDLTEDDAIFWLKDPDLMKSDTGIDLKPALTVPEYALAVGLVLAHKASKYFTSDSHQQHLLSSLLLVSATEARDYWVAVRGVTKCRNPIEKFVKVETSIKEKEFNQWFKKKDSQNRSDAMKTWHNREGGSTDNKESIRAIWANDKYTSKNQCALKEHEALCISYKTARNYLIGAPDPQK